MDTPPSTTTPAAAGGSWVFSSDLSAQDLEQIQGMIAMNGLNPGTADERSAATASDADAAFARMVAAYPNATIIDGPVTAAQPTSDAAAADEAFARLVAANPGATVIGGPGAAQTASAMDVAAADEALARIAAAHPGATVIRGPAGGAALAAVQSGATSPSTWHFSADISPERRAELMAFVGAQQTTAPADEAAQAAAADAAFQSMVEAQPGAVEVAPGVFSIVESPTGEQLSIS